MLRCHWLNITSVSARLLASGWFLLSLRGVQDWLLLQGFRHRTVRESLGPISPDNILIRRLFARGVSSVRPDPQWMFGYDGLLFRLPEGTTAFETSRVP